MSTPEHYAVSAQLAELGHTTIFDILDQSCRRYGDQPAFSCGADTLTFNQLRGRADAFARYLRQHAGLQPGDRLAIQLPNLLQYTIAIFGALRAGLVIVNTNPQYTPYETRHQFADSGARAVVVLDKLIPLVRKIQDETEIETLIVTSMDDFSNPQYDASAADEVRFMQALRLGDELAPVTIDRELDDLALLQYTGGTTGVSKGAMLTHRNILCNVLQAVSILKEGDVTYGGEVRVSPLPLYHIFAFTANCIASVFTGFHTILITNPRDLDGMIADLKRHPFTLLTGINSLFVSLMNHPDFDSVDFSRLKWVNSGGAPLNTEIARRWQERTGSVVREGYGLTETSPVVVASTSKTPYKEGFIGQPVIDTWVKTVDDDGKETPRGEPGEVLIKGPQVERHGNVVAVALHALGHRAGQDLRPVLLFGHLVDVHRQAGRAPLLDLRAFDLSRAWQIIRLDARFEHGTGIGPAAAGHGIVDHLVALVRQHLLQDVHGLGLGAGCPPVQHTDGALAGGGGCRHAADRHGGDRQTDGGALAQNTRVPHELLPRAVLGLRAAAFSFDYDWLMRR